MKGLRTLLAASLATLSLAVASLPVSAAQAPVHFADLNWESGSLITEVLRYIVEKGYDLPTDTLPGTTITLETALAKNERVGVRCGSRPRPKAKWPGWAIRSRAPPKAGGCRSTWSRATLPKASSRWRQT